MTQATEALTDTDHAILRAYGTGGQVVDIAKTVGLSREDVGFRLAELCRFDRGRARELSPPTGPEPKPEPGIDHTRVVPVDLAEPATRVLSDVEQEVMRSFGGGNDVHVIARVKRMEIPEVNAVIDLVGRDRQKAATVGRTGIVTVTPRPAAAAPPAGPKPAPKPAPAARPEPAAVDEAPTLSRRQAQLLPLLATDLTFEDIAARLGGIAVSTAYGLASDTYRALGTTNRADAVIAARRLGLLPATPYGQSTVVPAGDTGPDLLAIIAADTRGADTAVQPEPIAPDEPAAEPAPAAVAAGPTVEITIIRAGRTWSTVVELDPDDVDTTVSVRVRPPAGAR